MKKDTIFVNLYGGPGAGKSTMAALLFAHLKREGFNCELITEYAKDLCWDNRLHNLENPLKLITEQLQRCIRVNGKVDIAITDSPIILTAIYDNSFPILTKEKYKQWKNISKELCNLLHSSFKSLNIFLKRNDKIFYTEGRLEKSVDEARLIDDKVLKYLDENNIQYEAVDYNNMLHIINLLKQKIGAE